MGHLTNHVVICNWNAQSQRIVESIHSELLDESEQEWYPVVIVASDVTSFPDNDRFEDTLLVPGSPLNKSLLRRANVQDAHTVIIVADRSLSNPDDQTLQIALTVRSILEEETSHTDGRGPRIVAEVLNAARSPNFRRHNVTGIHEVVCETDLSVRVLAQTNLSPGLTYLLSDILEYDVHENDIYMVDITEDSGLAGLEPHRFAELVRKVAQRTFNKDQQRPALLLGLRRTDKDNKDDMLVNPCFEELERFGPLQVGDALVMLARTPKHARLALIPREKQDLETMTAVG